MRTMRGGSVRGLYIIDPTDHPDRCSVMLVYHLTMRLRIPRYVVARAFPQILEMVEQVRSLMNDDEEYDRQLVSATAVLMKTVTPPNVMSEGDLLADAKFVTGTLTDRFASDSARMTPLIVDTDPLCTFSWLNEMESGEPGIGKGVTVLDTSLEVAAASKFLQSTREQLKVNYVAGCVDRGELTPLPNTAYFFGTYNLQAPGFANRSFYSKSYWTRTHDTINLYMKGVCDLDEIAAMGFAKPNPSVVIASNVIHWEFVQLEPLNGVPQTKCTWIIQVDVKGSIPKSISVRSATKILRKLCHTRKYFDQSASIDASSRATFVDNIPSQNDPALYSETENSVIEAGMSFYTTFDAVPVKKLVKTTNPLHRYEVAKASNSQVLGRSTAKVRSPLFTRVYNPPHSPHPLPRSAAAPNRR